MIAMKKFHYLALLATLFFLPQFGQEHEPVFVDKQGIMRWTDSKEEVSLFGVNYTLPFAHAFRVHKYLGIDHKKAIDVDVYHFSRLGLDAYRCHLWDSEISDSVGNLLSSEQLDIFDYLIFSLKKRGIKSILTPLKFGSNGYPERDTPTPGFSDTYGKQGSLNNADSWPFQENYLIQFLNHINPYTGLSYKDDPDVIAFEINNEPGHKNAVLTRDYLETMIKAIRSTGCKKPLFYNMSRNFHVSEVFLAADLQGGTFQWYPSGLVANQEQRGNFLPNIDDYPVQISGYEEFKSKAKIVYEFDPADLGRSYTYPAIAREFREAGFQFATQFAYDPMYMAYANTEYQTHYMNLAYAPQKGLSLMIASEVFHQVPLNSDQGVYPENNRFGNFRLSYEKDLAELVSEKKYLYTNNTDSEPLDNKSLEQVAGFGNSPLVKYEGKGAYFLDRLEAGTWRLEVMPDAIWVRDPFEKASLKKEVSVILWKTREMTVKLEDLGTNFHIRGINSGNSLKAHSEGESFLVSPGTYLLTRKQTKSSFNGNESWNSISVNEFAAPEEQCKKTYLLHDPAREITAGQEHQIHATVVSPERPISVQLLVSLPEGAYKTMLMDKQGAYSYSCKLESEDLNQGYIKYRIVVEEDGGKRTFPGDVNGSPSDWDFYNKETWSSRVVDKNSPILLFNAELHAENLIKSSRFLKTRLLPSSKTDGGIVEIDIKNLNNKEHDYSLKYCFKDDIAGRENDMNTKKNVHISAYSLGGKPGRLQFALILKDGSAYGRNIELTESIADHIISLESLQNVKLALLPKAYPNNMPYWFEHQKPQVFNIRDIESIQFSVGPGIPESEYEQFHGIALEKVWLE